MEKIVSLLNKFDIMRGIWLSLLVFITFASCEDDNNFSDIPYLEYRGHEFKVKDEQRFIEMELYFNDRDGNIGLEPEDTLSPFNPGSKYFNNLWVWVYIVRNGVQRSALADTSVSFSGRIPNLTPQGQNKSLEGTIYFDITTEGFAPGDTLLYKFVLLDRDLNRSDTAVTPIIRNEL